MTDYVTIPVRAHGFRLAPMLVLEQDTREHDTIKRAAPLRPPVAHTMTPTGPQNENRGYRAIQSIVKHPGQSVTYEQVADAYDYLMAAAAEFEALAAVAYRGAEAERSSSSLLEATLLAMGDVHRRSAELARDAANVCGDAALTFGMLDDTAFCDPVDLA